MQEMFLPQRVLGLPGTILFGLLGLNDGFEEK